MSNFENSIANSRYIQVVYEILDGKAVGVNKPYSGEAFNFRIVSHHGNLDWSPFGTLQQMLDRVATLPYREDGFFKIVEG